MANSYVVSGIKLGSGNKIPLYLFGFLYEIKGFSELTNV